MTPRWMLFCGAALGALAVATGAFGAHALDGVLSGRARGWYDTAVTYHAGHALALFACGLWSLQQSTMPRDTVRRRAPSDPSRDLPRDPARDPSNDLPGDPGRGVTRVLGFAAIAFLVGIALFSGSLYAMAFSGITRLGMITPLGGVALIAGWIALAVAAFRLPAALS